MLSLDSYLVLMAMVANGSEQEATGHNCFEGSCEPSKDEKETLNSKEQIM